MTTPTAAIMGLSGTQLTPEERTFFTRLQPLGFILFARNIDTPAQTKALVSSLRDLLSHPHPLILIDQEGGRVARLKPPHWPLAPATQVFLDIATTHPKRASQLLYLQYRLYAHHLHLLGINVDCAPVLDIPTIDSDDIIGDRAFGTTANDVITRASVACHGLMDGGVYPVIKHIPGHGRAGCDSHKELPVVDASINTLQTTDFEPFCALSHLPFAMTAHIKYTALDDATCATFSPKVIELIRRDIGFTGLLMTDDLSMHALAGSFESRVERALDAGCDIALHCNGNMAEMEAISRAIRPLTPTAMEMLQQLPTLSQQPFDAEEATAVLTEALSRKAA